MTSIEDFLHSFHPSSSHIEKLTESGSGRSNYRFITQNGSYILTVGNNLAENNSFIYLSKLFKNLNANVPEVLKVSKDGNMYIQEDLGGTTLLQMRTDATQNTEPIYKMVVKKLAHLQIAAHQVVDYNKVFESKSFDSMLVYRDLFYFKDYFLDLIALPYSQTEILEEFKKIAQKIEQTNFRFFMFRDFQGRNIMVKDNHPYFIDYQDGMEGPIAYDVVSLLWQAKAALNEDEKSTLFDVYAEELKKLLPNQFNKEELQRDYDVCTLLRLMQVMGAYGKLGIIQQKLHFKDSLSYGVANLQSFSHHSLMDEFPLLKSIFAKLDVSFLPKI